MTSMPEFKVYRQQIDHDFINNLLAEFSSFKKGSFSVFRAQGTDSFEFPSLDEYGNQCNSIHNPHINGFYPAFSHCIQKIIFSSNVSSCLEDFTSQKDHVHFQSMLFDKSTGTKLHQDSWYLDTNPGGFLVGVWFALEDITEDAGPFYLYHNSPKARANPKDFDFPIEDQCNECEAHYPELRRFDFLPKKGDLLVWNSLVLHGAHRPLSPEKTRKSLTSHYYPRGLKIQDAPIRRAFSIYDHDNPVPTFNPKIEKAATVNPLIYSLLCLAMQKSAIIRRRMSGSNKQQSITEIRRL